MNKVRSRKWLTRAAGMSAALLVALGGAAAAAPAAQATVWWEEPPTCENNFWYMPSSGEQLGFYTKAGEYTRTLSYGGGTEIQYIWVWEVQEPFFPYGMVTVGRAEKHCGSDWIPDNGTIA